MFPTLTPTLGLFFVVPFVVIDSLEHGRPSGLRHCPKSYLNLACFAAGPSCSRLRFSWDSRSILTKVQPSPLLEVATCSCHMRVRDSNFKLSEVLGTSHCTPIVAKRVSRHRSSRQNSTFMSFLSYLGTPKIIGSAEPTLSSGAIALPIEKMNQTNTGKYWK